MKKIVNTTNAPAPIGPYSQAILAGNTLYVSGQLAIDPSTGDMRASSIKEETTQVMKNLGAILEAAGMDFGDIVKCSIFLSDMNFFNEVNEVYAGYFTEAGPARETVQVARLPRNMNVEVSAIAYKV
jgi:2-iminobutanoate/2-iminopropanoate deaminase